MEGCLPLFPAIDWLSLFRMAAARLFAPKEDAKPVETVSISQQAAQILDTYGDTILRYAYSYLHNQSDTEEVLQDTLIQFLKTRPVFESDEHEKAWLLRVAGNLCKNRLKYNSLRQTDELREELIAEQREDLSFIWDAVQALPVQYREVIHLFYREGYSTREISQILGRKEATIRSDLSRGRGKLKELLKEAYDFEV
ncbi:RNA polymerase sigma factor [Neopoerus faecalis]|uniref:RNA polymerase sigma factor n=1 Tax=Neopoerus faecalis TaxID=3032125 RepID=UPI0025700BA4|nr:sigma-70 family RNA polymerase sigma factor [Neopoerus faecalis]